MSMACMSKLIVHSRSLEGKVDGVNRLDGIVPSTPGTAKLNKSAVKRKHNETPSISRTKADNIGSSPDMKTPSNLEDKLNSLGAMP